MSVVFGDGGVRAAMRSLHGHCGIRAGRGGRPCRSAVSLFLCGRASDKPRADAAPGSDRMERA